ncbi:cold-shock protein [Streptomyces sp. NPDC053427]|uniref:cold-shock protein n=1 Tax=Streptomyces sp. NPDC053427 TaxID=3365701 RepID=UPI0037D1CC83
MPKGTVKSFNPEKGYGYIAIEGGGPDIYAHYSEIQSNGFRQLDEGDKVEFNIGQGAKGPQAEHIVKL